MRKMGTNKHAVKIGQLLCDMKIIMSKMKERCNEIQLNASLLSGQYLVEHVIYILLADVAEGLDAVGVKGNGETTVKGP